MNVYFERYAYPGPLFNEPPDPLLKIIVVIPCFNEPDIATTLDSLKACEQADHVEVIIIVNEPENGHSEISKKNARTLADINTWRQNEQPWFNLLACHLQLPVKDAGVGLARKAGMDEAARRFEKIGNREGVIACFDADSTCKADYFTALDDAYYKADRKPVGSSVYFEHPFPEDPQHRNGIIQYELHLRYYVQALRWAEYPFAYHTVGSSMVVRADVYQKIGGMNKRKAGEDFYFLHRLIPAGYFTDITATCIYPSPRVSQRVPFGTGKAMGKWQEEKPTEYFSYNLNSFRDLKALLAITEDLYQETDIPGHLPDSIVSFLQTENFKKVLSRLNRQSKSPEQFMKNFYAYFDGFKVLKYLHNSRDNFHQNKPVTREAINLLEVFRPEMSAQKDAPATVLDIYRQIDRASAS